MNFPNKSFWKHQTHLIPRKKNILLKLKVKSCYQKSILQWLRPYIKTTWLKSPFNRFFLFKVAMKLIWAASAYIYQPNSAQSTIYVTGTSLKFLLSVVSLPTSPSCNLVNNWEPLIEISVKRKSETQRTLVSTFFRHSKHKYVGPNLESNSLRQLYAQLDRSWKITALNETPNTDGDVKAYRNN